MDLDDQWQFTLSFFAVEERVEGYMQLIMPLLLHLGVPDLNNRLQ